MRDHILVDGRQLRTDDPQRGELLVHTREEWANRYTVFLQGRLGLDIILLATCVTLAFVLPEPVALVGRSLS